MGLFQSHPRRQEEANTRRDPSSTQCPNANDALHRHRVSYSQASFWTLETPSHNLREMLGSCNPPHSLSLLNQMGPAILHLMLASAKTQRRLNLRNCWCMGVSVTCWHSQVKHLLSLLLRTLAAPSFLGLTGCNVTQKATLLCLFGYNIKSLCSASN